MCSFWGRNEAIGEGEFYIKLNTKGDLQSMTETVFPLAPNAQAPFTSALVFTGLRYILQGGL